MTKVRKPRKPLSAYNLFFQEQREKMLCFDDFRRGGDGYADMARAIASKWNNLERNIRNRYVTRAKEEKKKHAQAMAEWKKVKKVQRTCSNVSGSSSSSVPSSPSVASTDVSLDDSEPEDCNAPFTTGIPADVMSAIDAWANAFTSEDNADNDPVVPQLSLSSDLKEETLVNNDTLEMSADAILEKRIAETIDDLKASVDDDFVGFMSSIFD